MSPGRADENPPASTVSERLKQLDETGPALGPPTFDLDEVMQGGERRLGRRSAVGAGAAVLTAGAGLVLGAFFTGALPDSFWTDQPVPPTATVLAESDLAYVQHGAAVLVSSGAESRAGVTLESVTIDGEGRGTVELAVESTGAFTLNPADFIWAGHGADHGPAQVGERTVDGSGRFRWTYDEVSPGELAWTLPGTERLAAVWSVGTWAEPAAVEPAEVWYLQREATVTAYRGADATASLTAAVGGRPGIVRLGLAAHRTYEFRADDLVWAAKDGSQHAPSEDNWTSLSVSAGGVTTQEVDFGDVGEGHLLWAPGGGETMAVW